MKIAKYGFVFVLIVAIALLLMNGSLPAKYVKALDENVGTGGERISDRNEAMNDWQSFVDQSKLTITANEQRITAFKEMIEEAGPKALVRYRTAADELEQKNSALKRMLEIYLAERRTDREHFQMMFRQRLDSVGRTIQKVMKDNGEQS